MIRRWADYLLALGGGLLLALMLDYNSLLAAHTTSVVASWVAHGLGAVGAFAIILLYARFSARRRAKEPADRSRAPLWFYLGGIPGAFAVILAALAVNSSLTLSGSIALMLFGQVVFGMVSDHRGWFLMPRRRIVPGDFLVASTVLAGSALIVFGG